MALCPQFVAANSPVGSRIISGWTSSAIVASFTSRAPIFRPRYSGVRPTIMPATNMPMITNISMLIMPTPLPPKMQFSHIPVKGGQRGNRVQAVVFAVDRAAGHVHRHRGERRARRGAEAHFLAFEIAQMLIHRQPGNRRREKTTHPFSARRCGAGDFVRRRRRMRRQPRVRLQRVEADRPDDRADHHEHHHREDHQPRAAAGRAFGRTSAPARTGTTSWQTWSRSWSGRWDSRTGGRRSCRRIRRRSCRAS